MTVRMMTALMMAPMRMTKREKTVVKLEFPEDTVVESNEKRRLFLGKTTFVFWGWGGADKGWAARASHL